MEKNDEKKMGIEISDAELSEITGGAISHWCLEKCVIDYIKNILS